MGGADWVGVGGEEFQGWGLAGLGGDEMGALAQGRGRGYGRYGGGGWWFVPCVRACVTG